jgi:hypothetical protein
MPWHSFPIKRPLRVAYMAGEGITGFRVRLRAWMQHHDNIEQPGEFRMLPRALSLPACTLAVVEALRSFKPDIVVTDTLNVYFGAGNENDNRQPRSEQSEKVRTTASDTSDANERHLRACCAAVLYPAIRKELLRRYPSTPGRRTPKSYRWARAARWPAAGGASSPARTHRRCRSRRAR